MLYTLHEAAYYAATPMRAAARLTRDWWSSPLNPARNSTLGRSLSAGADLYENVTRRYGKPDWHIDEIRPARIHANLPDEVLRAGIFAGNDIRDEPGGRRSVGAWLLTAHLG